MFVCRDYRFGGELDFRDDFQIRRGRTRQDLRNRYSLKILRIHRSDSSSVEFQRKKRAVLAATISPATDRGSNLYHGKVVDEGHSAAGLESEMGSIVLVQLEPAVEDVALTVVWK